MRTRAERGAKRAANVAPSGTPALPATSECFEDREVNAIFEPLGTLKPRQGDSPPVGEPGVLEALARQAGLAP